MNYKNQQQTKKAGAESDASNEKRSLSFLERCTQAVKVVRNKMNRPTLIQSETKKKELVSRSVEELQAYGANLPRSSCGCFSSGCFRVAAREVYTTFNPRFALEKVRLYKVLRPQLHSYCEVTGNRFSSNNIHVCKDALDTICYLAEKGNIQEQWEVVDELKDVLIDTINNWYDRKYEQLEKVLETAKKIESSRPFVACSFAANAKYRIYESSMKGNFLRSVAQKIIDNTVRPAIKELARASEIPVHTRRRHLAHIVGAHTWETNNPLYAFATKITSEEEERPLERKVVEAIHGSYNPTIYELENSVLKYGRKLDDLRTSIEKKYAESKRQAEEAINYARATEKRNPALYTGLVAQATKELTTIVEQSEKEFQTTGGTIISSQSLAAKAQYEKTVAERDALIVQIEQRTMNRKEYLELNDTLRKKKKRIQSPHN
jgi:hypothetical protein